MSQQAATILISAIRTKPDLVLCAATGNSPAGLYRQLTTEAIRNAALFRDLRLVKLDEWGGTQAESPHSCEYYLSEHLVGPLQVSADRYLSFRNDPEDPEVECKRVQTELNRIGPIDLCILGIGKNGHLGFNEPAAYLQADCHVARLSDTSMQHKMIEQAEERPAYGLTLGMGAIMQSRKVLLLISGAQKEAAVEAFLSGKISTALPASLLWLHPDVVCLIDDSSIGVES